MDQQGAQDAQGTVAASAAGPDAERQASLARADAIFAEAKSLRSSDPERAVELFGECLQLRVEAYGPDAIECATAYVEYGVALFTQARNSTDVLGAPAQQAMDRHEAAAAGAGGSAGASAGSRKDGEEPEDGSESDEDGASLCLPMIHALYSWLAV